MAFTFEPSALGPSSHFRVRGAIFMAMLKYADNRGIRPKVDEAFRASQLPPLENLYLAAAEYDIVPLAHLTLAMARAEGGSVEALVKARARSVADADLRGIYKLLLKIASPAATVERLPRVFNRYFPPCTAENVVRSPGRVDGVIAGVPVCIAGLYTSAVDGFVSRALEMAGANETGFRWGRTTASGEVARIEFVGTWR